LKEISRSKCRRSTRKADPLNSQAKMAPDIDALVKPLRLAGLPE